MLLHLIIKNSVIYLKSFGSRNFEICASFATKYLLYSFLLYNHRWFVQHWVSPGSEEADLLPALPPLDCAQFHSTYSSFFSSSYSSSFSATSSSFPSYSSSFSSTSSSSYFSSSPSFSPSPSFSSPLFAIVSDFYWFDHTCLYINHTIKFVAGSLFLVLTTLWKYCLRN